MLRAVKQRRVRAIVAAANVCLNSCVSRKRSIWVKDFRRENSHSPLLRRLQEYFPDEFKTYLRMDSVLFNQLLEKVSPLIQKQDTQLRQSFSPNSRLTATLEYLATGSSFEQLQFATGMAPSTLRQVTPGTCKAIFDVLKTQYLKFPSTEEDWLEVASGFERKWDFINCGGAVDGKHIRVVAPRKSGARFYNYKGLYSFVLVALVDSNYEFLFVDVGKNGRFADGGIIEDTVFYRKLKEGSLNIPDNTKTKGNLNFVFLGDAAFATHKHFVQPYPSLGIDYQKRVFNYRLSRGRNVVEGAFGIITSRFAVLQKAINLNHESACYVVLAICALHNYLRRNSPFYSNIGEENLTTTSEMVGLQNTHVQDSYEATVTKDRYKKYFNFIGAVHFQDDMIQAEWA